MPGEKNNVLQKEENIVQPFGIVGSSAAGLTLSWFCACVAFFFVFTLPLAPADVDNVVELLFFFVLSFSQLLYCSKANFALHKPSVARSFPPRGKVTGRDLLGSTLYN